MNRLSGPTLPVIALIGAVGLGCASLAVFGTGTRGIRHSLEITARWSYLWFWVAYAGGALCKAFGERFRFAAKHRREFGLAFATAHSIHLILVVWLYRISPQPPISFNDAVFFSVGIAFMYMMVILSIKQAAALLPRWLWAWAMFIGLEYIEYAFLTDFLVNPLHASPKLLIGYLPFATLGLFGTLLRLVTWLQSFHMPVWQPQRR